MVLAAAALKDPQLRSSIKGVAALTPITVHYDEVPDKYKSMYKAYDENGEEAPIVNKASMQGCFHYTAIDPKDERSWPLLDTKIHKDFPPT